MKIIIVEDEAIMMLFLQECLEELGHEVVGCYNNADDLFDALSNNSEVDLILMDISIKGQTDGIKASHKIRKNYPYILLIFITSFKDSETIKDAKEVKPNGYMIKPIQEHDIEAALMLLDLPSKKSASDINILYIGEYKYNMQKQMIYKNDEIIKLSKKEHITLHILIKNINTYISQEQLILSVWNDDFHNRSNSLRELVYRLRKKLPLLEINSIPNIGYILKK